MITAQDIQQTYQRIQPYIQQTPLVYAAELSKISGAEVYLKMEHLQLTGSFKIRGVMSKILSLDKTVFDHTFVAASTGNHAAAFGYAARHFKFKGILFLPKNVNSAKVTALTQYPVEQVFYGEHSVAAEAKATIYAKENNGVLIHPYNDLEIIKGQGTVGLEIKEQLPKVDTIMVPIGGGGLASGVCSYFQEESKVAVVGCQPILASEMYASVQQNKIVTPSIDYTIADAAAGGIEENAITFEICKKHLSDFELVSETALKKAIGFLMKQHQIIVEPTAALPVAAILHTKKYKGKQVVLVLTGRKINEALVTEIQKDYDYNY